jgi:hypothetical protein
MSPLIPTLTPYRRLLQQSLLSRIVWAREVSPRACLRVLRIDAIHEPAEAVVIHKSGLGLADRFAFPLVPQGTQQNSARSKILEKTNSHWKISADELLGDVTCIRKNFI